MSDMSIFTLKYKQSSCTKFLSRNLSTDVNLGNPDAVLNGPLGFWNDVLVSVGRNA